VPYTPPDTTALPPCPEGFTRDENGSCTSGDTGAPPATPEYQGGTGGQAEAEAADARLRAQNASELATLPPCIEISRSEYSAALNSGDSVEIARVNRERTNCHRRWELRGS
jgi:hypothetical protein